MPALKAILFSLIISLMIAGVTGPASLVGNDNDIDLQRDTGMGSGNPINEKFEGGVKAYDRGDEYKTGDMSPHGPGGN